MAKKKDTKKTATVKARNRRSAVRKKAPAKPKRKAAKTGAVKAEERKARNKATKGNKRKRSAEARKAGVAPDMKPDPSGPAYPSKSTPSNPNTDLTRGAMVLLRHACRQHYKIPDAELDVTPKMALAIVRSRIASRRTKISAARLLLDLRRFTFEQLLAALKVSGMDGEEAATVLNTPFALPGHTPSTD